MEDTKAFDGLMVQKTRDRLPYEPYTGGKPSPSPEYKQEPEDAGKDGSIEVKVGGRNLFDGKFESGSIRQDNGENQDYADRIRTAGFIQIKPSTVYSIKLLETISFSVRWYDKDKKFIKSEATNTISQSPDNARYMRFLLLTTKLIQNAWCMPVLPQLPTNPTVTLRPSPSPLLTVYREKCSDERWQLHRRKRSAVEPATRLTWGAGSMCRG